MVGERLVVGGRLVGERLVVDWVGSILLVDICGDYSMNWVVFCDDGGRLVGWLGEWMFLVDNFWKL